MTSSTNRAAFALATPLLHRPSFTASRAPARQPSKHVTLRRRAPHTPLNLRMSDVDQTAAPENPVDPVPSQPLQPQSDTPEAVVEEPTTSAADILKSLREDSAADAANATPNDAPRSMLGVYRDVDGRSNVWAVEPLEQEDTRPQISKVTLLAAAAGFIVLALLVLPLLPFTNPDQL